MGHYPKIAKTVIFACFGPFASFHKIPKKAAGTMGHYGALSQNRKKCDFCAFWGPFASFHKILKRLRALWGTMEPLSQNRKNCDFCVFWQFCKFPQNPEKGCGHYGAHPHLQVASLHARNVKIRRYSWNIGSPSDHPKIAYKGSLQVSFCKISNNGCLQYGTLSEFLKMRC